MCVGEGGGGWRREGGGWGGGWVGRLRGVLPKRGDDSEAEGCLPGAAEAGSSGSAPGTAPAALTVPTPPVREGEREGGAGHVQDEQLRLRHVLLLSWPKLGKQADNNKPLVYMIARAAALPPSRLGRLVNDLYTGSSYSARTCCCPADGRQSLQRGTGVMRKWECQRSQRAGKGAGEQASPASGVAQSDSRGSAAAASA